MSIEDTKPAHALLSPSGADRWMVCTGSVALSSIEPENTSDYADEGSAAHWLGSVCLLMKDDAAAYIGRKIQVINGVVWDGVGPKPQQLRGWQRDIEREFIVDEDMARHVQTYLDNVRGYAKGNVIHVEQALPIGHLTGEKDATGTGDAIIITDDGEEIQAHDLKFGRGVEVRAENNRQLKIYGLGALEKFRDTFEAAGAKPKRFRAVIHQPRVNEAPDEWDCLVSDLEAWGKDEVQRQAKTAMGVYRDFIASIELELKHGGIDGLAKAGLAKSGMAPPEDWTVLIPGEKQCRFCLAKATCPALARFVQESLESDFETLEAVADPARTDLVPEKIVENMIATLDDDALGRKVRAYDVIEMWGKAVRARVEHRLLEARNDSDVARTLGFKLVQGKRGNRKWRDETVVEEMLKKQMRLKNEVIYDMSLKSPPALEKIIAKENPKRWNKLLKEVEQRDGQPHVAPLNDRRPSLVINNPADDFVDDGADLV